jgi:methylenetetrahydrofolate reductase (NADPH)
VARFDALLAAGRTLSVELWPARDPAADARLRAALVDLEALGPSVVSITYGGGGSARTRTHELVVELCRAGWTSPMAHLSCIAHSRDELVSVLAAYSRAGVENLLALRGDPPSGQVGAPPPSELQHAIDLVELARSCGSFCVAVAAHPEGHPAAADLAADRRHLAAKLEAADLAITQLFFGVEPYLRLVEDLSRLAVSRPVVPGVMPITSVRSLARMTALSGCAVPTSVAEQVARRASDPAAVRRFGVDLATEQCARLLDAGAPGLHFYTMNQTSATREICANLKVGTAGFNRGLLGPAAHS